MEGSREFLDEQGEWHYDQASRTLYIMPPAGAGAGAGVSVPMAPVLTQTATLFHFEASLAGPGTPYSGQTKRQSGILLAFVNSSGPAVTADA